MERDPALERRLQPVKVEEPSAEETQKILAEVKVMYEEHHNVDITGEAVKAAATLATRFIPDRFLPDKAIDLLDEAGSRVRLRGSVTPTSVKDAMDVLERVRQEKDEAIAAQQYEVAAELRDRELRLNENLLSLRAEWREDRENHRAAVTEEDIAEVVSMWTGIPVTRLGVEETARLMHMEEGPAQAHHRPGRGHRQHFQGGAPGPGRPQRPPPSHRRLYVPRPHRRGQNRTGAGYVRSDVRA